MKRFLVVFAKEFSVHVDAVDKLDAYNRLMDTPMDQWLHADEPETRVHIIVEDPM